VWDSSTGKVQNVLEGHTNGVWSVAFSPDGSRIVSGSFDNSVRVWDSSTGKVQNMLEDRTIPVLSVAFSSDGSRIASGSKDISVRETDVLPDRLMPFYVRETLSSSPICEKYTGWLVSPHGGEYLMFVPLDERLPHHAQILIIPRSFAASVDFTGSHLGTQWRHCYSP